MIDRSNSQCWQTSIEATDQSGFETTRNGDNRKDGLGPFDVTHWFVDFCCEASTLPLCCYVVGQRSDHYCMKSSNASYQERLANMTENAHLDTVW